MTWYLEKMEQMLSADDKKMLKNIYEPKEVVVPPRDTYVFSGVAPDGELRLYGTIGRGKHQQDALGDGYLYSRDCGLSWHPHLGTGIASENGCGVRSPISGRYLHCYHSAALIYEDGPDGKTCREVKIFPPEEDTDEISPDIFPEAFDENGKRKNRNKMYGLPKHPIFLESKPGRCVIPFTRDTADSNFRPVVAISDDDGEHWKHIELPVRQNTEIFYPDKGYRWANLGSEPTVCELADGTLYLLSRTSTNFFNEYFSYDHGDTWVGSGEESMIHSTLATPLLLRLHDGRTLLLWNNTRVMPRFNHHHLWPECHYGHFMGFQEDMFTNRDVAHAAISTDGKHWVGQREIGLTAIRNDADYRRAGGRYNIADKSIQQFEAWELPYNKVFVVMGQSISTRRGIIFDLDWLCETSREEHFAQGLKHVTTHQYVKSLRGGFFGHASANRLPGTIMTVDPEDSTRSVVQLARFHRPELCNERAGLVWNFPVSAKGKITIGLNIVQSGIQIGLSDHWQNPSAPDIKIAAASSFVLQKEDLPHGGWNTVTLSYDTEKSRTVEVIDETGRVLFAVPITLPVLNGMSYLHLQSLATEVDLQGTLICSLEKEAL